MAKWNVSDKPAKVGPPAPAPSIADELAEAFNDTLTHLIVLVCMVETNTLPPSLSGFQGHIDKANAVLAKYRGMKE